MKLSRRLALMPVEAVGNLILIAFLVCGYISNIICKILSDKGVFYIDVPDSIVSGVRMLQLLVIFVVIVTLIATKGRVLNASAFKYILFSLVVIWVGICCSLVYFHSTLMLLIPLLISRCYNSYRMTIFSVVATVVLIAATPILAFELRGMDASFPMWYVSIINPNLALEAGMLGWNGEVMFNESVVNLDVHTQLLIWVALPRVITVMGLLVVSFASNYTHSQSHERQINHILTLQKSMIDSMSEVIENRDTSTGGHVKRTRETVGILIETARKYIDMPAEYWNNIMKSAAMHDLGKISISDAILTKPGRLTKEEFELIKEHPVKSKCIIDKIFANEEDNDFRCIAENIALYHHEKYDGSGYPEGLKENDIPLEARIMAIADVYDALVSERCYKKAYSFDEAYNIIKESMGSHFDPQLWGAFENALPQLEAYYSYNCRKQNY